MKLKPETIRKRCKVPVHLAKSLDLSGLELVKLEHLDQCENLHWLKARNNNLESDEGLENLKQLWYLDLSNNSICFLNALSRYLALGTVILSNNNLKWIDLEKIRHAHFLSISLHGNPELDSDPYYRIHVIDCLPLIWDLDGRLVTVMERIHVNQFFIDTALTSHPIRHKMGKTFRTTAVKNIGIMGVVSKQCKYIYSKFPMSEKHTKHTDERRLRYLTHMIQEDILSWASELDKKDPILNTITGNFLENLLEQRQTDTERCNMFLLLLVISLEYQLPTSLIRSSLNVSQLETIGNVNIMSYFLLPPIYRTRVICLLLNAAKVDRDNNVNNTGGLYPQLFMSLYYAVDRLIWISQTSESNQKKVKPVPYTTDYKALMAGEAVALMLNIPKFLRLLCSGDTGVANLILTATGNYTLVDEAQEELIKAEDVFNELPMRQAHKVVRERIQEAIYKRMDAIDIKMADIPVGDRYLALSDCLPIRPLHSVIWASEFLTKGMTIPKLDPPILNPAREAAKTKPQEPKIGDKLLLGPQVIGDITMLLKGEIALAKIDGVPVANGAIESKVKDSEAHYTYVDLKALCYATDIGMWRPKSTEGDKFTIHTVDPQREKTYIYKEFDPGRRSSRFKKSARFSFVSILNEDKPTNSRGSSNGKAETKQKQLPNLYSPEKLIHEKSLNDGVSSVKMGDESLSHSDLQQPLDFNLERNLVSIDVFSEQLHSTQREVSSEETTVRNQYVDSDSHSENILKEQQNFLPNTATNKENTSLEENAVFLTSVKDQEEGMSDGHIKNTMNQSANSNISKVSNLLKENYRLKVAGRPRPMSSKSTGLMFPPPQRPSSPITRNNTKSFVLRLADTDRWLAGGRDLYWEQLKQRPKSGHTPGWKEGLPVSMRKPRPKSAFTSSAMYYPSNSPCQNVTFVPSCSNCQNMRNMEPSISYSDFKIDQETLGPAYIGFANGSSPIDFDNIDRDQLFIEGYRVPTEWEASNKRIFAQDLIQSNLYSQYSLVDMTPPPSGRLTTRHVQSAKERTPMFRKIFATKSLSSLDLAHQNKVRKKDFEMSRSQTPNTLAKSTGNEVIQVYIEERTDYLNLVD
ncbi:hypothetical protein Bpfe_018461 [Biomphalaria pfeifferi]|uniref:Uncharacterized protein n=1 Tax=Biomphalaria pfeifferi TaxID=112525 RepID=A0AAD8F6I0_BIOPF|nr:hypothetical protein Bpfe_018461 [Biomphalaria pfeifferi]